VARARGYSVPGQLNNLVEAERPVRFDAYSSATITTDLGSEAAGRGQRTSRHLQIDHPGRAELYTDLWLTAKRQTLMCNNDMISHRPKSRWEVAMTDWVTVALSGGSVCVGAGLTMLGQYLADIRSRARDREARREGFRITNYEIQRSALMELQEIIIKLSKSLGAISARSRWQDAINATFPEDARVLQWYHMRDVLPELKKKMLEGIELATESRQPETLSAERRKEIATRAKELAEEFKNAPKQLEPSIEFFDDITSLTDRVKILSARAGNDKVFTFCQELERMVNRWCNAKDFTDSDQQIRSIKQQIEHTLDEIGSALRLGPLS